MLTPVQAALLVKMMAADRQLSEYTVQQLAELTFPQVADIHICRLYQWKLLYTICIGTGFVCSSLQVSLLGPELGPRPEPKLGLRLGLEQGLTLAPTSL